MAKVVWEYVRAVFKHWVSALAGALGVILLVISLAEPRATRSAGIALVILAVVIGQFLAWRDMRTERDAAQRNLEALTPALEYRVGVPESAHAPIPNMGFLPVRIHRVRVANVAAQHRRSAN